MRAMLLGGFMGVMTACELPDETMDKMPMTGIEEVNKNPGLFTQTTIKLEGRLTFDHRDTSPTLNIASDGQGGLKLVNEVSTKDYYILSNGDPKTTPHLIVYFDRGDRSEGQNAVLEIAAAVTDVKLGAHDETSRAQVMGKLGERKGKYELEVYHHRNVDPNAPRLAERGPGR